MIPRPGGGLQSRNKMQRKVTQSLKFLGLLEELGRIPGFPTARQRLHQLAASAAQTFLLLAVPRVRWLSLGLELSWPTLRVTISVSPISTLLTQHVLFLFIWGFPLHSFSYPRSNTVQKHYMETSRINEFISFP